ncbi:MAG: glycosyltransferase family 2 protein [Oscillospiraceae bacterium]|nr:glycosyltransferase family 2 protein [Oscillospiraceae bacterium]MCI9364542.1 glycosyltransferase family 2 protein [Oscillospiraceae bacterium]RKJ56105.1 glycosyltransferase [bacterium 1XD42-8]RKJ66424.1 glycosyltransferase [bacterium 1XD42-1]
MTDILYIVVPCYNEEEVLPETARRLQEKMTALIKKEMVSPKSRVLFVDDGSKDSTWEKISSLHQENPLFSGLKLSHNRGHQNALIAGLMTAREPADIVISMDADLQDDIEAVDQFLLEYQGGSDIVYGVRSSRTKDTVFKRTTAVGYYKLLRALGVEIVENHADYRLMSKRALNALAEFKEVNLFLRGIVPLIGFRTSVVKYERNERFAGESKYPLKKMLAFAIDGVTSFSVKPIRFITWLGVIIFCLSVLSLAWILADKLFGKTVSGWATLMGSIWALGGIQLLCLGILGEYISKIYQETKQRPRFFIDCCLDDRESNL